MTEELEERIDAIAAASAAIAEEQGRYITQLGRELGRLKNKVEELERSKAVYDKSSESATKLLSKLKKETRLAIQRGL